MKKFLMFLVAATLMLSVTACKKKAAPDETKPADDAKTKTEEPAK
jgi:predicted small lipoprotein YifL